MPKGACASAPDAAGLDAIPKGAYVLAETSEVGLRGKPRAVIIATGSEVPLALKAQELLAARRIAVRVVSMPSTTVFDRQSVRYKNQVLPEGLPRVAVEMGATALWWKYGCAAVVGIDCFANRRRHRRCSHISDSRPRMSPIPCSRRCAVVSAARGWRARTGAVDRHQDAGSTVWGAYAVANGDSTNGGNGK